MMRSYAVLIVLIVGVALGVALTIYGPDYVEPILPGAAKPAKGGIKGQVAAKRLEQGRLLVTVSSPEGAILVTFKKKVPEIDLLVEEGDTVNLDIRKYRPFVEDPDINRVRKPERKAIPAKEEPPVEEPAEPMAPAPGEETAPVMNSAQ